MNQEYPYSVSTGRIKDFFAEIQRMGTPARINTKVLPSLGFKSTNDRAIVSILKSLDLIDASGVPTASWKLMRTKDKAPFALAEKIRAAYPDLFAIYPDANTRPDASIRNFIQGRSNAGERAVGAMVTTFKVLCSMADFSEVAEKVDAQPTQQSGGTPPTATSQTSTSGHQTLHTSSVPPITAPQVAINLQIQLPDGADADYLDNVFESIARHILGRESTEEVVFADEDDIPDEDQNIDEEETD